VQRYKVEPYVACADVYSVAPHIGRGGWTWYTGSAAWLYRAGLEALLGFQLRGDHLRLTPCIPKAWPGFTLTYQHRGQQHVTPYTIQVENPRGVCAGVTRITLDGQMLQPEAEVALTDDGAAHTLRVTLG
jgi:cyclic beta-1,2-glucan synthetase